ncbi:perlucin-like [Ostrea edulis]|uniref:perlucin-like n=1 Tax=Ostrea edulis TaxID=37623 RepID=UPI002094A314|nr:perlucin-like [Ostrea edulis]
MRRIYRCGLTILVLIGVVNTDGSCPSDWFPHRQSCYAFITKVKAKWVDAVDFCRDSDAELVEIETADENSFLRTHLQRNHTNEHFWVGGTDAFTEGHWIWINTRQPFTFTDWAPLEPYQGVGNDCMTLAYHEGYHWNDDVCDHKYDFICEKEALFDGEIVVG